MDPDAVLPVVEVHRPFQPCILPVVRYMMQVLIDDQRRQQFDACHAP